MFGELVGEMFALDGSDWYWYWSNRLRYHNFETTPDTQFNL